MVLTALWASPVGQPGGVGRHLSDVARVGVPGWRLVFLVPEGPVAGDLRALGAAVVTGSFGPESGLKASALALRDVTQKVRPQIVHTHLSYADIVSPLATAGLPTKLVTTEHGIAADDLVYHSSRLKSALMARAHATRFRRFAHAIAVSEATKSAMLAKWHPRIPVTVIPNGIDQQAHPPRTPGLRIASIARLSPEKRIDALIRAFVALHEQRPEATLTIAGDGPLDAALRAQADHHSAISFVGHTPAEQLLASHDVVVQLSVWENCSYTLLDAMAAGLGVVATPVGGNPELLPLRCLVEADDVDGLVNAMIAQGLDPITRPDAANWSTVDAMATGIGEVYASLGVAS